MAADKYIRIIPGQDTEAVFAVRDETGAFVESYLARKADDILYVAACLTCGKQHRNLWRSQATAASDILDGSFECDCDRAGQGDGTVAAA